MYYFKFFGDDLSHADDVLRFQLYAATVKQLNDPFEGRIGYDPAQLETKATEIMARSNQRSEIICLSQSDDDSFVCKQLTMWAHYANKHHGFCVKYNKHLLDGLEKDKRENSYVNVRYDDPMPVVTMDSIGIKEDRWFVEAISHKSPVWQHEQEVRLIFRHETSSCDTGHLHSIPPQSMSAIYIGKEATCDLCTKLVDFANRHNIPCYKMTLNPQVYELIPVNVGN